MSYCRQFVPRPRLVLLRSDRVRSENTFDGCTRLHLTKQLDTSGRGLHVCLRDSAGVRALAASPGPRRRVALPIGEPKRYNRTVRFFPAER